MKHLLKIALLKFIEKYPENFTVRLRANYKRIFKYLNFLQGDSFSEKCYRFTHSNIKNLGICFISKKPTRFISFKKGYNKYFSSKEVGFDIGKLRRDNAKKTMMKIYGVDHPSKLISTKEKIKQHRMNGNYDNVAVKIKSTLKEKYGNENYVNIEKMKETKFKKYGNEFYSNRKKMIDSFIRKYGQKQHPNTKKCFLERLKNKQIGYDSDVVRDSIFKKYGVVNISSDKETQRKKSINLIKQAYDKIINGDRLQGFSIPLFSEDEYKGGDYYKLYKFQCKKCNNIFENILYSGNIPKCNICYPNIKIKSIYELEIFEYLKVLLPNENIIHNTRSILDSGLELDFFIPSKNIAIEFNGIIWHSELFGKKDKNYHLNKTKECEFKNIKLIHIFEDEWVNKQYIVKNRLKHILKLNNHNKIYARKCEIRNINHSESSKFLEKNHIQGKDNSSIQIGCYYNNELVSVMTFGKLRIALGNKVQIKNEYEMYRFCVGENNVTGIASKFMSFFIKNYNPSKIISFADKRFSNKNAFYSSIGMTLISETPPNYWYFNRNSCEKRFHRFNFRKDQLHKKLEIFDPNLTEWENMQLNGYDRIWDCGNLKYVWNKPI